MSYKTLAVSLLIFVAFLPANAREQKATSKTKVLRAARLFDGKSNTLVKPGIVVVTAGNIVATGANAAIPAGAEVIELGDATLLPGFIDAHTHLTFMHIDDYKQAQLDRLQKPGAERAVDATANAKVTLMAGFTTVRDVGSAIMEFQPRPMVAKGRSSSAKRCHRPKR